MQKKRIKTMAMMKKKGMAKGGKVGGKMTLAKLRAEAKKMGYKLVKIA